MTRQQKHAVGVWLTDEYFEKLCKLADSFHWSRGQTAVTILQTYLDAVGAPHVVGINLKDIFKIVENHGEGDKPWK